MNARARITIFATVAALGASAPAHASRWAAVNGGLPDRDVHVLATTPSTGTTLYAGGPSGVFRSIDGGATWSATGPMRLDDSAAAAGIFSNLPGGFRAASIVAHLAIDPRNPDTIYAGTVRSTGCAFFQPRLHKSTDGGASWVSHLSPNINGCDNIHAMALAPSHPSSLYLANYDDATGDTWSPLVRTTDGAATWTYLSAAPVFQVLAIDPVKPRHLFGATYDAAPDLTRPYGVLRSEDGGATWNTTGLSGAGITALALDPADPRVVVAAVAGKDSRQREFRGLVRSRDQGTTWFPIDHGLHDLVGTPSIATAIVIDPARPGTSYLATHGGGIWKSSDGGASWSSLSEGLESLEVRSLVLVSGNPGRLYAATPKGVFMLEEDRDPDDEWMTVASPAVLHAGHTATLLENGKVLVAGGTDRLESSAELYDPASRTWTTTGPMNVVRWNHSAIALPDGRVLVVGGDQMPLPADGSLGLTGSAEVYDPRSGTWTSTGNLVEPRTAFTATLLDNGQVLVAGGVGNRDETLRTTELFEPATGIWRAGALLEVGRFWHTATRLRNGEVLVAAGYNDDFLGTQIANVEIYAHGEWKQTIPMRRGNSRFSATLLGDGRILVAGGLELGATLPGGYTSFHTLADSETYDPGLGIWLATGTLGVGRYGHTALLLGSGQVLVVGGTATTGQPPNLGYVDAALPELFDPVTSAWRPAGIRRTPRLDHTTTSLPDGSVLVVGGSRWGGAELYVPRATSP